MMMAGSTGAFAQRCQDLSVADSRIRVEQARVDAANRHLTLTMRMRLDSLRLRANHQLIFTPVVQTKNGETALPKIVVNGRRQQIMTERGFYGNRYGSDARVVRRYNGKPQTIDYTATIPVSEKLSAYSVRLDEDVCGCGDIDTASVNHYPLLSWQQPKAKFIVPKAEAV